MNRLILGHDAEIAAWVSKRVPRPFDPKNLGPYHAIGVEDAQGSPLAGFVYTRFKGHDVEITGASTSPRWAQRGVICALLHYPFIQMGCVRVTMFTAKRNKRARRVIRRLGFVEEGTHPLAFDGTNDAVSYGLLRDKWLAGKYAHKGDVELKEAA